MNVMPSSPYFHLFRWARKNPRGVTYDKMLVKLVVHHDLPDAEIEQECGLLKEQIVRTPVRRVMELLDADNRRVVVFVKSQQRNRITSMPFMIVLDVIHQFCALRDCVISAELRRGSGKRYLKDEHDARYED